MQNSCTAATASTGTPAQRLRFRGSQSPVAGGGNLFRLTAELAGIGTLQLEFESGALSSGQSETLNSQYSKRFAAYLLPNDPTLLGSQAYAGPATTLQIAPRTSGSGTSLDGLAGTLSHLSFAGNGCSLEFGLMPIEAFDLTR